MPIGTSDGQYHEDEFDQIVSNQTLELSAQSRGGPSWGNWGNSGNSGSPLRGVDWSISSHAFENSPAGSKQVFPSGTKDIGSALRQIKKLREQFPDLDLRLQGDFSPTGGVGGRLPPLM